MYLSTGANPTSELSTLTQGSSPWLSAHSSEIRKEMQRRPNWLQDALDRKMGGPNKEKVLPARVRSTASRSPGAPRYCSRSTLRLLAFPARLSPPPSGRTSRPPFTCSPRRTASARRRRRPRPSSASRSPRSTFSRRPLRRPPSRGCTAARARHRRRRHQKL